MLSDFRVRMSTSISWLSHHHSQMQVVCCPAKFPGKKSKKVLESFVWNQGEKRTCVNQHTHTKKKVSVKILSLSQAKVGLSHGRVSRKTLAEMQHYFLSEPNNFTRVGKLVLDRVVLFRWPKQIHGILRSIFSTCNYVDHVQLQHLHALKLGKPHL